MHTSRSTSLDFPVSLRNACGVKGALAVCCVVAFAALSGCGKKVDGEAVGQNSSSTMNAPVTTPANTAVVGTQSSTAVVGTGTAQALSNTVDDVAITASIAAGFAKDADLSAIKIDVDTKNGVVSLIGPAPSVAARDRATTIAKGVKGVNSVDNKLVVKGS